MTDRKRIPKNDRVKVYNKYNGHCAYCGEKIEYKDMQVDHLNPLRLGGVDEMENYMPSCRSCNHYKRGNNLEGFRRMIEEIPYKLYKNNYIFKIGVRYKHVKATIRKIKFHCEDEDNVYHLHA